MAEAIYAGSDFDLLPILGDALEEAGYTDQALLDHCRSTEPHGKGCWAMDRALSKRELPAIRVKRSRDGFVGEIEADPCDAHLEEMEDDCWWLGISAGAVELSVFFNGIQDGVEPSPIEIQAVDCRLHLKRQDRTTWRLAVEEYGEKQVVWFRGVLDGVEEN